MTTKHIFTSSLLEGSAKFLPPGIPGEWELRVTFDYRSSPLLEKYTCGIAQAGADVAEYVTLEASDIYASLTKSHIGRTTFYPARGPRDVSKPTFIWGEDQRDINEVLAITLDEERVIQEVSLVDPGQSYFLTCSLAPSVTLNGKEERVVHHFNTIEEPCRTRSDWMRVDSASEAFDVCLLSHYGKRKNVKGLVTVELRPVKE